MTLNDIIQAAQGGQGVNNLASRFGLTPEQTQAAIQAMIPAFSMGLQKTAQDPTGLGGIIGQITNAAHQASYSDPSQTGAAATSGGGVLGQIFGSPQVTAQLGQRVSQMSGVSPQVVQQMMPVVASMLMGGLFHTMNGQGLGGVLGQLANAAANPGGLGSVMNPPAGAQPAGGGLGGLFSGLLGSLMGGAPQATAAQAGLNTLSSMFEAGVQVAETHQQGMRDILNSFSPPSGDQ
jgi:hypothetical protein